MMKHQLSANPVLLARSVLTVCLVAAAFFFVCGCKPEAKVAETTNPTGVYALATVDGKAVPTKISHEGATLEVRSGTFTIQADGACSTKTAFVPPSGSEVTREVSATYTREGSKLIMKWQGAGITTGTVEGNTFTMNNEGMLLVYRK